MIDIWTYTYTAIMNWEFKEEIQGTNHGASLNNENDSQDTDSNQSDFNGARAHFVTHSWNSFIQTKSKISQTTLLWSHRAVY